MSLHRPLQIGHLRVAPGLLLAPMEEVTDHPFRLVCRQLGADLVYTEFVNAEGLIRQPGPGRGRTWRKLYFHQAERPVGIQLYGASHLSMEAAARLATECEPDLIDVNCGCWVPQVARRGAGAGLLRDLGQMRQVVRRVRAATHLPVTVKTRLGWDGSSIRIVEVAKMLQDEGIAALTVHCRTRAQGHKGTADHNWIERIKAAVDLPVILNGDVVDAPTARAAFEQTGCDGVMIGRGAIRHPWAFREIRHHLATGDLLPGPTRRERAELCLHHLRLSVAHLGERHGVISMRRHYAGYFRDLPGAARLRGELCTLKELQALEARLLALAET